MVADNVSVAVLGSFYFAACDCWRVNKLSDYEPFFVPKPSLIKLLPFCPIEQFLLPKGKYWGSHAQTLSAFCTFMWIFPCCQQNSQAGVWLPSVTFPFNPGLYCSFFPPPACHQWLPKQIYFLCEPRTRWEPQNRGALCGNQQRSVEDKELGRKLLVWVKARLCCDSPHPS